ncbi:transcriptional regulator, SARP family [Catenulispora acidiphila DSM 44928]|uniref:Transcriptional regulator, SARP family n=1 Tax=Catenulispora acidiphila (strain DSM 44928 / JCM 14897 / NBRC 102108 / NRRL B-24433 / ID139908) TaxID=479433 RepID=C7Q4W3_CATAD|nr:BTAD domain-containing putative transcriptional regulator [Catenulispora acidiphila]ACU73911.1 transcriptional regulator, SARP family [Catenulispora acidiphila DSM 44928]
MRIRLLGPVEAWGDQDRLDIGSAKSCLVLAALTIAPGHIVPWDVLVDRVWGEQLPGDPKASLYAYVARLRRTLDPAGVHILSRPGGYLCDVPPESVDLARFQQRVAELRSIEAADAGGPDTADRLTEALAWWQGTPLANLTGEWVTRTRRTLNEERLAALLLLADVQARHGRLADLAADLLAASAEYPLSEPLAGYVIRALAAAGRRAEALDYYADVRSHLVDELGEEPGAALQQLHVRLLRRDPSLADEAPPAAAASLVPRQLPSIARHFVGRRAELKALDGVLTGSQAASAVLISAISGTAGIGKTTTVVYWAHHAARQFPDGQLYVNLRGFDPTGPPMKPEEAIRGFLDVFAVPKERIPHGLDAQAALYRSLLAGRRMLVVLDNARDADHVRPLLPGSPGCLVLVTSRSRLTGLVVGHGATPITLGLLDDAEAEHLLSRYLGAERVAAEPDAVRVLIQRCARLPLALAVAAARALMDPAMPLGALAAELAAAPGQLDALDTGDPSTTARAVFSWSYLAQRPEAQRLFRLLGLHPGPDISVPAAASLTGLSTEEAAALLSELTRAHLLTEHASGRYSSHDLLRSYAAELVQTESSNAERDTAFRRMLHHYLHSSYLAGRLLDPHRKPITPAALVDGVIPESFADQMQQALRWFEAEREVLLAVIRRAAAAEPAADKTLADEPHAADVDTLTWELAWTVTDYLDRRGHWQDWLATQQVAMQAAQRLGDQAKQAHSHRLLANAYIGLVHYEAAADHLSHALDYHDRLGDLEGTANCRRSLCRVRELQGRYPEALAHAEESLRLFRATDNTIGQARALNAVGWLHILLDDPQPALEYCQSALALFQELGSTYGEAVTWDSVGSAHHRLGQTDQAIACFRRSIDLLRTVGDRHTEAETLTNLGDAQHDIGQDEAARTTWQQALEICEHLDHPDAEKVRTRLHALRPTPPQTPTSAGLPKGLGSGRQS